MASNMTRLDTLEPEFRKKVTALLEATEKATGRKWALSDGRRTLSRQEALWAQGRTIAGKVVTMAKGGQSPHNFGLAADLWPLTSTGDFDWGADADLFRLMGDHAAALGLVWGGTFKSILDFPHVEEKTWRVAQAAWKRGDLKVA